MRYIILILLLSSCNYQDSIYKKREKVILSYKIIQGKGCCGFRVYSEIETNLFIYIRTDFDSFEDNKINWDLTSQEEYDIKIEEWGIDSSFDISPYCSDVFFLPKKEPIRQYTAVSGNVQMYLLNENDYNKVTIDIDSIIFIEKINNDTIILDKIRINKVDISNCP